MTEKNNFGSSGPRAPNKAIHQHVRDRPKGKKNKLSYIVKGEKISPFKRVYNPDFQCSSDFFVFFLHFEPNPATEMEQSIDLDYDKLHPCSLFQPQQDPLVDSVSMKFDHQYKAFSFNLASYPILHGCWLYGVDKSQVHHVDFLVGQDCVATCAGDELLASRKDSESYEDIVSRWDKKKKKAIPQCVRPKKAPMCWKMIFWNLGGFPIAALSSYTSVRLMVFLKDDQGGLCTSAFHSSPLHLMIRYSKIEDPTLLASLQTQLWELPVQLYDQPWAPTFGSGEFNNFLILYRGSCTKKWQMFTPVIPMPEEEEEEAEEAEEETVPSAPRSSPRLHKKRKMDQSVSGLPTCCPNRDHAKPENTCKPTKEKSKQPPNTSSPVCSDCSFASVISETMGMSVLIQEMMKE